MRAKLMLLLGILPLLIVTLAHAQTLRLTAKIPFDFVVEGKTLPAGQYEFTPDDRGLTVNIVGADRKGAAIAAVITRIGGAIHTTKQDAHIVFDDVGGVYTLSEMWHPGQDGWLLFATKGKHQHRTVDVPR
jgi:hypothetical protein